MNTGCHPDFKDPPSRPRTGANPGQTPNEHPTYRVRVSPPPPRTWRDSQRPATVVSPGQIRDHSVKGRARPRRAAPDSAPHQDLGAKPQPTRSMGPYRPTAGTREGPPRTRTWELKTFFVKSSPGPDPFRGQNCAKFARHRNPILHSSKHRDKTLLQSLLKDIYLSTASHSRSPTTG